MRTPLKRTLRSRFLLPAGLLSVAAMASLAMFFPGTNAGASGHADASQISITGTSRRSRAARSTRGVTLRDQCGNPFLSSFEDCLNGHLIRTATLHHLRQPAPVVRLRRPAAVRPDLCQLPRKPRQRRHAHGSATIGPNLQGVGAATVDFWVSTGRMPATDLKAVEAERSHTPHPAAGARARRLGQLARPCGPRRPYAAPRGGEPVGRPGHLALNCAACHTIEGSGDTLAFGTKAPSLKNTGDGARGWLKPSASDRPTCPASRAT